MVNDDDAVVAARLAERSMRCDCGAGWLAPWGSARSRLIRHLRGAATSVTPRRGRCTACGTTHVLLPCSLLVRRRDSVEVIGAALMAHAKGDGHRRIAARLERPDTTVRGWLRRLHQLAEPLRVLGTVRAHDLDPLLPPIQPAGSPVADAVEALGVAASAARRRLGGPTGWNGVAALTRGRLLAAPPRP